MRAFPNMAKLAVIVFLLTESSLLLEAADPPPAKPAHRVIACYFHRTAACRQMSVNIENALKTGFPEELINGQVEWLQIDFQAPKNQKITSAYKIEGPTLVIMNVNTDKVTSWKTASKISSLVNDREAFFDYVQKEVRGYLDAKK